MAVEQKDILDALDQMGIYLPDIGTEEEQMKALVGAISTFQSQRKMKKEQEQRAKEEADRQQQIMKSVEQRTFTATTYKFGGGGGGGGSGACNDIRGGYGGAGGAGGGSGSRNTGIYPSADDYVSVVLTSSLTYLYINGNLEVTYANNIPVGVDLKPVVYMWVSNSTAPTVEYTRQFDYIRLEVIR